MEIRFNTLEHVSDVEKVLKDNLQVDHSTLSDVQAFLEKHGLNCSLPKQYIASREKQPSSGLAELTTKEFDSYISCRMAAPKSRWEFKGKLPWKWMWSWVLNQTVSWEYFIHFSFKNDVLVEFIVEKKGTGF